MRHKKICLVCGFVILMIAVFNGCRMAEVNPNAISLKLNFAEPSSYPFLETLNICFDGTNFEHIEEVNKDIASIYCFIWDASSEQWEAIQGYGISYPLTGNIYPFVRKFESFHSNEINYSETEMILPDNTGGKCRLMFTAYSQNKAFAPRYCICEVDLLHKKRIVLGRTKTWILFFDYSIYMFQVNVDLPSWDNWSLLPKDQQK